MKELSLFTESEKKVMRPLLQASQHGDHDAAVKFKEMWLNGCKRALAEYKKHPENEEVISEVEANNIFWDETVKSKISELEHEIAESEKY